MHPRYLDRQALVACWREGLLAQAVISKSSGGYSNHPQLQRFRACDRPLDSLGAYLSGIVSEADARGYRFAREKIRGFGEVRPIALHSGQLAFEWAHLLVKVQARSAPWYARIAAIEDPDAHPLFRVVPGPIELWERPR